MSYLIDVIGIGGDGLAGLRPELVQRIVAADFLAGGERNLSYIADGKAERFVIKYDFRSLRLELEKRRESQRCVVLASGDPLFYGIGDNLLAAFGSKALRFEPAVSSMQLAFARAGVSWRGADIVSIHGRDARRVLFPVLGRLRIGIFCEDGQSPALVAQFFSERGCIDYTAWVAENLSSPDEKITQCDLRMLPNMCFSPLNFLILLRNRMWPMETRTPASFIPDCCRDDERRGPGIPDDSFAIPADGKAMMTSQEVRAILVGKFPPIIQGDVAWDIGAGLGTVTVELAVARPEAEIHAIEKSPQRMNVIQQNLSRFDVYNVRTWLGEAPDVCADFPADNIVRFIFIGGSGGRLEAILECSANVLHSHGKIIATFVTLENLSMALSFFRGKEWKTLITEVNIAHGENLAGLTSLKPERGVFIFETWKPDISPNEDTNA